MKHFMISVVGVSSLCAFAGAGFQARWDEFETFVDRMEQHHNELMQKIFDQHENYASFDLGTYAHGFSIEEAGNNVIIKVSVPATVKPEDILVEVVDKMLHVQVKSTEKIELFIDEKFVDLAAERHESGEQKNAQGLNSSMTSMSYANERRTLPATVNVKGAVDADLTEGILTLTLEKNPDKNPRQVVVTKDKKSVEVTEKKASHAKKSEK